MAFVNEKGHSPELVYALQVLVKRLEATPEELRGPFLVKGLKPYLAVSQPIGDGMERYCPMVKFDDKGLPCGAEMVLVDDGGWVRADQAQSALAAMGEERDATAREAFTLRNDLGRARDDAAKWLGLHDAMEARAETAEAQVKRLTEEKEALRKALNWALGCTDDFRPREDGEGAYWWRKELADRAGMTYDREAGRFVALSGSEKE